MSAMHAPVPELFALLGHPVAGNPTQQIVEAAFRDLGLDWRYVSIDVGEAQLSNAFAGLRGLGFRGAHITKPHKVAAVEMVDELTPVAAASGAVNCIVRTGDRLLGDNTDGIGLVRSLGEVTIRRALVLGAGGAARAIAASLISAGATRLTVCNRDGARAASLAAMAQDLGADVDILGWPSSPLVTDADVVVNATSLGMEGEPWPDAAVVDWSRTGAGCVAADAVITTTSEFLAGAAAAGRRVVDGVAMLVEQAAESLRLWTGREPSIAVIRAELERHLPA